MRIGIDPGHGGSNTGTRVGLTTESEYVLKFANELGKLLSDRYNVAFTRTTDVEVGLAKRGRLMQEAKADFVVSLHVNAGGPTLRGGSAFHYLGSRVGQIAAVAYAAKRPEKLVGTAKAVVACQTIPGHWTAHALNVLAVHKAPAVLIELFFGTDKGDTEFALTPEGREGMLLATSAAVEAAAEALRWQKPSG